MGAVNTFRLLMQARRNQWLRPSELEELQAKRLRAIVTHAYDNTEFYRRKFKDAGISPEDIRTVEIPGVGQFKAIQERKDLIRILVVKGQAFIEATAGQIVHDVKEVMGGEMHVDVEVVEEIPKDKLGKVRCAVSKIEMVP